MQTSQPYLLIYNQYTCSKSHLKNVKKISWSMHLALINWTKRSSCPWTPSFLKIEFAALLKELGLAFREIEITANNAPGSKENTKTPNLLNPL